MHKWLYNKFIIRLYMFRAICAQHQEVRIVLYSVWYRPVGGRPVHGLREDSLNPCTLSSLNPCTLSSLNLCTGGHLQVSRFHMMYNTILTS
jgi:hypothetical protein